MKKQSGFTLIELMVVMAIIAILATAGLAAYTGYIKKARDTTRIADISAINTIVLGTLSSTGSPPQTALEVYNVVMAANNGQPIVDPLTTVTSGVTSNKSVCMDSAGTGFAKVCSYTYRLCDAGSGFAVGTRFESASNKDLYTSDDIGGATLTADNVIFELGSCQNVGTTAGYIEPIMLTCSAYTSPNCTSGSTTALTL